MKKVQAIFLFLIMIACGSAAILSTEMVSAVTGSTTITGTAYNDRNGNGMRDASEPSTSGVSIKLYSYTTGQIVGTTNTDSSGHYIFTNVPLGGIAVLGIQPSGTINTQPGAIPGTDLTGVYYLTILAGQSLTADFGNHVSSNTLTGIVFNDANGNGVQDSKDNGVGNVNVELYSYVDKTTKTSITTNNGHFSFNNVPVGGIAVLETVSAGQTNTQPGGSTPGAYYTSISPGATVTRNFGNFGVVSPTPTPTPTPVPGTFAGIDPFGVQMIFGQKAGKQQIVMGIGDPNSIPGFGLDGGSSAVPNTQGAFHYYSITPRTGGLAGGGTQLTMRINLNPQGSTGSQVDWHQAEIQGYMVSPNDINEFEQTGYFRLNGITKSDDITMKQGGTHTGSNNPLAGSFGAEFAFNGVYGKTFEKELNHPLYEFFSTPVTLNTGSIVGKWIGVKETSQHTPNGQLYKTYIDLNPIDFSTGKPLNNWQLLSEKIDDGKENGMYTGHITSWGKKYFTYRIDDVQNIDFALLSVHHIDTATNPSAAGAVNLAQSSAVVVTNQTSSLLQ